MNKWIISRRLLAQDILCPKKPCFKPTGTPSAEDDDRIFYCATRNEHGCPHNYAPPHPKVFKMILMYHKAYYKRYIIKEKACRKKTCFAPRRIRLGYHSNNTFDSLCDTWLQGECPMEKPKKEKQNESGDM